MSKWLLKDVDSFAGFAHALYTFLGGVCLAYRHGMQLIHRPITMAHGLGFAFDDFLMRGFTAYDGTLLPPLA